VRFHLARQVTTDATGRVELGSERVSTESDFPNHSMNAGTIKRQVTIDIVQPAQVDRTAFWPTKHIGFMHDSREASGSPVVVAADAYQVVVPSSRHQTPSSNVLESSGSWQSSHLHSSHGPRIVGAPEKAEHVPRPSFSENRK
jgi:hypothetical protein